MSEEKKEYSSVEQEIIASMAAQIKMEIDIEVMRMLGVDVKMINPFAKK